MHLVLVGFMGTGKSTVGRLVAQKLNRAFYDIDTVIEDRAGKSIPKIFEEDGEAAFRDQEARTLHDLLELPQPCVIASGGGVLLNESNRSLLDREARTVCLTARLETLLQRLSRSKNRPLLEGDDLKARIETLMQERASLYAACSLQIATDGQSISQVADEVIRLIGHTKV